MGADDDAIERLAHGGGRRSRGMADRLIRAHVPDEHGRCRACPIGASAGHHRWPCKLRSAADAATRAGR